MQQHPAELARRWLAQARDDLASARYLFERRQFATCCFLCQQSAEKALKGLLHWRCGDFPRTHVIGDLLGELATVDAQTASSLADATGLDPFYTTTRYPDAIGGAIPAASFHRDEALLALRRAEAVLGVVEPIVPRPAGESKA
jgi:HEPN domain-containing protein